MSDIGSWNMVAKNVISHIHIGAYGIYLEPSVSSVGCSTHIH